MKTYLLCNPHAPSLQGREVQAKARPARSTIGTLKIAYKEKLFALGLLRETV
ncbi:hypothetical protein ACMA1I_01165 [Pontibacter sp. 13R65]|uniref:hypothetical protein n=1 Tax=Pontibacter sp. 13R65 TaxID=3127458 RepID=UPI00301BE73A